ncbi:Gfo/Idh/MocA family oxidoreductase [Puniceicoccaceae bacterium K14]|nr:Gfo/Idh/MocA family oxidoreductase [Puniceicoccaceae bacterium K14]
MNHPKQKIRTAIIGYGLSGELSHAYGIQANPEFEITAVCDLSHERRTYAEENLGCQSFPDHMQLLRSMPELDLAAIVTRSDTHCSIACDFLRAGVDVLITKPWALNSQEAGTMIRVQNESKQRIFPWIPMYWSPEYLKIKELLNQGVIGTPFTFRRYITQFSKRSDWQTQLKHGGGYLNNWGAHIVQPLLALANSPVVKITGHMQQVINSGDADDNFLAVMTFENGILAVAEYAQAVEGLPSFMIQGTSGMIRSDGNTITLIQKDPSTSDAPNKREFPIEGKLYGDEAHIYRDVAATLLCGAPFKATPEESYYGTAILDAVRDSHQSKNTPLPTPYKN